MLQTLNRHIRLVGLQHSPSEKKTFFQKKEEENVFDVNICVYYIVLCFISWYKLYCTRAP